MFRCGWPFAFLKEVELLLQGLYGNMRGICRAKSFEFKKCAWVNLPTIRSLCTNLGHVLGNLI